MANWTSGFASTLAKNMKEQQQGKIDTEKEQAKAVLESLLKGEVEPTQESPSLTLQRGYGILPKGGYKVSPSVNKQAEMMKNALLTKEYEAVMNPNRPTGDGIQSPTIKTNVTGVPTYGGTEKGKIEPFIQVQTGTDKYGNPEYTTKENPAYTQQQKKETKIMEFDVKKEQLRKDLDSFFAIDDKIDRAQGGLLATRGAGIRSQYRAMAQPIDPQTGKPTVEGIAARVHDAAAKRLRVQLVRAAGDVGAINIVEQEAAEKLIPGFYDSDASAKVKRAYLQQLTKAIEDNSPDEVKKTLDNMGINYLDLGKDTTQTGKNQIGEIVYKGGKNWKITGFDTDGTPLVDEVQ